MIEEVYKIYNHGKKGYKLECQVTNIDDLFIVLDMLILEDNATCIFVIKKNILERTEEPMYIFTGNIEDYIDYKDNYYYRHR